MKKILLLLFAVTMLGACEKYNDQFYDKLEEQGRPLNPTTVSYTLTDEDYASISKAAELSWIKDEKYLNSAVSPSDYIPMILKDEFPGLGKNSAVSVSYKYNAATPEDLTMYSTASNYELIADDYQSFDGALQVSKYYSPKYNPELFIPNVLDEKVTAETGELRSVSFLYSDVDPLIDESQVGYIPFFQHAFESELTPFTAISTKGDNEWYVSSYNNVYFAKISGYSGGALENEDWLVSPSIDLSNESDIKLLFSHAMKFQVDYNLMKAFVSTDYTGNNFETATWTEIFVATQGGNYKWYDEEVNLSSFVGNDNVHIGFRYQSTDTEAATWEVTNIKVARPGVPITGKTPKKFTVFYEKTESGWSKLESAHFINDVDYNAMGLKYSNFSISSDPDAYLPKFLDSKYPAVGNGASVILVYKYSEKNKASNPDPKYIDHTIATRYTYSSNIWTSSFSFVQLVTEQYVHNGTAWFFDPTIRYKMVSEDYQAIVDVVKVSHPDLVNKYGTGESYYGSDAYNKDFDVRLSSRSGQSDFDGLSDEEAEQLIDTKISEGIIIFLQAKYPDAILQVNGIDVYYEITYETYGGTTADATKRFKCTKAGPNPEFEISQ